MKFLPILKLILILSVVSLACTVSFNLPASGVGETQTFEVSEAAPSGSPATLHLTMVGGTFNLNGGSDQLVSGTIEYNINEWKPTIERVGDTVYINQSVKTVPFPRNGGNVINRWDLQLGNKPMILDIGAGAYEGTFNLGGVPIVRLDITEGASNSETRFDTPNPEQMSSFNYQTGASNVKLTHLVNANFKTFTFKGGAGNYELDFGGTLQRDATADVQGAVGEMTIIVPQGTAAEVNVTGGLSNVNTTGSWSQSNDIYTLAGTGPKLTINVQMSVGQLKLVSQ